MKSDEWKPGDIVQNTRTGETAHFLLQVGHDGHPESHVVVLPRNGEDMFDEKCWPTAVTERIMPFTILEVVE